MATAWTATRRPPGTDAFLVGLPYPHHARHSGYDGFSRYVGVRVKAPVRTRRFPHRVGRALDRALACAVGQPKYSVGVLLAEAAAAAHMLRRERCLYHVMYGERDLFLLRGARGMRGNRLIATFHGPLAVSAAPLDWVQDTVDAAVLVSDYQRRYFEPLLPAERIFVARHGIDTAFFRPAPPPPGDPVCITVGSHQRDFATMSRAAEAIWDADPSVRFLFVGVESPGELGPLREDPRVGMACGLSDEALRDAYQGARLALFAFRDATASNALLEAMACGLPIVATDVGGVGEYVAPGGAHLSPAGDAEGLANGVLGILADPDRALDMGRASRAAALGRDYRVAAAEMRAVYERLLHAGD
jgi:glycosyltransferase involved in cell wall biosynthesis